MGVGRILILLALVGAVALTYCTHSLRLQLAIPKSDLYNWASQVARYAVPFGGQPNRFVNLNVAKQPDSDNKATFHELAQSYKGVRTPFTRHIVAVGDLHGDLPNARRVLRFSDVIDDYDNWSGNVDFFVQTGDIIDRSVLVSHRYTSSC
jgi:hypothetical protein